MASVIWFLFGKMPILHPVWQEEQLFVQMGVWHLTQQLQLVVRNITQAHLIALRQKVA